MWKEGCCVGFTLSNWPALPRMCHDSLGPLCSSFLALFPSCSPIPLALSLNLLRNCHFPFRYRPHDCHAAFRWSSLGRASKLDIKLAGGIGLLEHAILCDYK
jgi:hypothetical protein